MRTRPEITQYNKQAWNHEVEIGNLWTIPVSPEEVASARKGSSASCSPP